MKLSNIKSNNSVFHHTGPVSAVRILLTIAAGCLPVIAEPSGGPYGPIRQIYELPKIQGKIYFVAPDGKAEASGITLAQPTTLEAAMERVSSGDAIILRGGVYRTGDLVLNQQITMQPYLDEQPVLKGTYVASNWKNLENGLWTTSWSRLFPSKPLDWWLRHREGKKTPMHRFNDDMVFVDGRFLQSAAYEGEVDGNSFYIDYDAKKVYIGTDPKNHLVEITAYNAALLRTIAECHGKVSDRKGPIIRGITFTQYALRALEVEGHDPEGLSDEFNHGQEVVGTTIEHCTISYCSRVAAYLRGDHLTLSHCRVSDTSTEGIYIIGSDDVLLEKNIFRRNNIEKITGYFPAAVKIFNQCYRVTCNDNLVIEHPYSNGIWYDVGNVDGVFTNNWVQNVGNMQWEVSREKLWPSDNGFFFEISKHAICAGNVFVNCDHGIMVLNSSDVEMYQNTLVNSMACIGRNGRSVTTDTLFGSHSSTGPDVYERDGHVFINNLLAGDENFDRPFFYVWQPDSLCGQLDNQQMKQIDNDIYVRGIRSASWPLMLWSPTKKEPCQSDLESPEALNRLYPDFSAHSLYFAGYDGFLFKSPELEDYHIFETFPGSRKAGKIPDQIRKLLGMKKDVRFVGAYPPIPLNP